MKRKFVSICIILYSLISIVLVRNNHTKTSSTKYDAIIVLGNSPNYNNNPNPFLRNRLKSGIEFIKKGYSDKIILTGGTKEGQISEAELMKRFCIKNGISADKIITESKARSTKENLIFTDQILTSLNLEKALVITSGHHLERTKKYCELLRPYDTLATSAAEKDKRRNSTLSLIPTPSS